MTLHDAIIIKKKSKLNMVKPSKPLTIVFKVKMLGKKKSDGV